MSEIQMTMKDLRSIKDALLAKKQGEALERITRPISHEEGLGLGHYGSETVLALSSLCAVEDVINELTGLETQTLHTFTRTIGISSGSRGAKRMEKGLETIGQLGQYIPSQKGMIPTPEAVDAND